MTADETIETLRSAGWVPGRRVDAEVDRWEVALSVDGGFSLNDPARQFLLEFGGLVWPTRDAGTRPTRFVFDLDPTRAWHEEDRFALAEAEVGENLCPVGEVLDGHFYLAVGAKGGLWIVMDDAERYADDAWGAFERLLSRR